MKILYDDYNGVYVWVDDVDENDELSPRFDYVEDCEEWYHRMKKELNNDKHQTSD